MDTFNIKNQISRGFKLFGVIVCSMLLYLPITHAQLHENPSYTKDWEVGETNASFVFSFTYPSGAAIDNNGYFSLSFPTGFDITSASIDVTAPSVTNTSVSYPFPPGSELRGTITGSISPGDPVTITVGGVDISNTPALGTVSIGGYNSGAAFQSFSFVDIGVPVLTSVSVSNDTPGDSGVSYTVSVLNTNAQFLASEFSGTTFAKFNFPDGTVVGSDINIDNSLVGTHIQLDGQANPSHVNINKTTGAGGNFITYQGLSIPDVNTTYNPIFTFQNITNPSSSGIHSIGIEWTMNSGLLGTTTYYGVALVPINNTIDITAIVTEALIMTLDVAGINLTVDPAVANGQDLSESSVITVLSNAASGYVIQASLDDGLGNAQLRDNNGNVISGSIGGGDNYFGYTARNDAIGSATTAEQGFSAGATVLRNNTNAAIGLSETTDGQQHTVNYDLNVNFLTPAGIYTGTIFYTVVSGF